MTKQKAKKLWVEKIYNGAGSEPNGWDEDYRSIAAGFFIALGFTYKQSMLIYKELIDEGTF